MRGYIATMRSSFVLVLFGIVLCMSVAANGTPCSGSEVLTSPFGTITDGSDVQDMYSDSSSCLWLIKPETSEKFAAIRLNFTRIDFECNYDYVYIYDGMNASCSILSAVTGSDSESLSFVSSSNTMFISFKSDLGTIRTGFSANYSIEKCPSGCSSNGWCNTTSCSCDCYAGFQGHDCSHVSISSEDMIVNGIPLRNRWNQLATGSSSAPVPRIGPAFGEIRTGEFFLFGGFSSAGNLNDVWQFKTSSGQWNQISISGPSAVHHSGVSVNHVNHVMYIFGGQTSTSSVYFPLSYLYGSYSSAFWKLSVNDTDVSWTQITAAGPSPRIGAACAYDVNSNLIWLFGGFFSSPSYSTVLTDTWQFNATSEVWTLMSPPLSPSQRVPWSGTLTSDGYFYIYGGSYVNYATSGESGLWSYNTATNIWDSLTPTLGESPGPRQEHQLITIPAPYSSDSYGRHDTIALLGGMGSQDGTCDPGFNDLWIWNTVRSMWQRFYVPSGVPFPIARRSLGAALGEDSTITIFGGEAGIFQYLNDIWTLDVSRYAFCSNYSAPSFSVNPEICLLDDRCGYLSNASDSVCLSGDKNGPIDGTVVSGSEKWNYYYIEKECSDYTSCSDCSKWDHCGWCRFGGTEEQKCVSDSLKETCDIFSAGSCPTSCSGASDRCQGCANTPTCGFCATESPGQRCMDGGPNGPWNSTGVTCSVSDWSYSEPECPVSCVSLANTDCNTCTNKSHCGWCQRYSQCYEGSSASPDYPSQDLCDPLSTWIFASDSCPGCSHRNSCAECTASTKCAWCKTTSTCHGGDGNIGPFDISCPQFEYDLCAVGLSLGSVLPSYNINETSYFHMQLPLSSTSTASVAVSVRLNDFPEGNWNISVFYSKTNRRPGKMSETAMISFDQNQAVGAVEVLGVSMTLTDSVFFGIELDCSVENCSTIVDIYPTEVGSLSQATLKTLSGFLKGMPEFVQLTIDDDTAALKVVASTVVGPSPPTLYLHSSLLPSSNTAEYFGVGSLSTPPSAQPLSSGSVIVGIYPWSQSDNQIYSLYALSSTPIAPMEGKTVEINHFVEVGKYRYYQVDLKDSDHFVNCTLLTTQGQTDLYMSTTIPHPGVAESQHDWVSRRNGHQTDYLIIWSAIPGYKIGKYYFSVFGTTDSSYTLLVSTPKYPDYGWFLQNLSTIVMVAVVVLTCMNFAAFGIHRLRMARLLDQHGFGTTLNINTDRPRGLDERVLNHLPRITLIEARKKWPQLVKVKDPVQTRLRSESGDSVHSTDVIGDSSNLLPIPVPPVLDSESPADQWVCVVCLGEESELPVDEKLCELPCGHLFHFECIKPWLLRSTLCPLCNHDVTKRFDSKESVTGKKEKKTSVSMDGIELQIMTRASIDRSSDVHNNQTSAGDGSDNLNGDSEQSN